MTTWLAPAVAAITIALATIVAQLVMRGRSRRHLATITARVRTWHGSSDPRPIGSVGGSGAWQDLVDALDELAASYARRAATLDAQRPWRLQLVDALAQPALLFDSDGRLQAANAAACDLLDLPTGARDLTVLDSTASTDTADAVERVRADGASITVDATREGRDLRVSVSRIGDEILVAITDRTVERRIEDLRRDFVVNASHELKTPVTAIQTLAEALTVTLRDDPARAAGLVKRLNDESERLARLVGELLDLRRLEVGGPLERVPVDIAELIRLVVAEALPHAEERGIEIEVALPARAHVAGVRADLEAVVKNLLTNAIKYNRDRGSVRIALRTTDGAHLIEVSDTGIGIGPQDLPRVFERFYRVDTARSRATGGTGLGLSIVRHAVERHGGTVQVESTVGRGSTFTVMLPIEPRH
jgi:signal transduction histidine kinase